jgi:5-methylcytosine-specific restriction endonuclease McrA
MKPARINKKVFKKTARACRVCGESNYELLDTHRITPGSEGGKYTESNSVVLCCKCHRSAHAGLIVIDRYYLCSDGTHKLRILQEGVEKFI